MSRSHCNKNNVVVNDDQSRSLESQPLLSPLSQPVSRSLCSPVRRLCIMSKPVYLVLLMTVVVGSVDFLILGAAIGIFLGLTSLNNNMIDASLPFVLLFIAIAFIFVFYPVSGFLADIYCGRHNVIFTSLCLILCSIVGFLLVIFPISFFSHITTALCIIFSFCLLLAIIGLAGYGANFIQFGLDQLLEAPSQDQALFVHWAKWCYDCLSAIFIGLFCLFYCKFNSSWNFKWILVFSVILIIGCILLSLVVFSCWKRHWFYTESRRHNPYKMVAKVLIFALKHKYPLQRSAFTYCDDERPSRLDFAKERFGGPFTTEQVEDVKVLLRIVLILLAIGPVFSVGVMINNISLTFIGLHFGSHQSIQQCPWDLFVTNAGMLRYVVSTLIFPAYMWIIFSLLRNRVPKMLTRIGYGMILYFIGMMSVLAIDSIGHHLKVKTNKTDCIWQVYHEDNFPVVPSLGMHWSMMIPSVILLGIGPTLVTATVFEFISAQSPHPMKGFLFGVFFAIRVTFQFLGSIAVFVFSSQKIWQSSLMKEHPPVISCLSRCILFLSAIVLIGFIIFLIVAKRYKYRERGDRPYDQRFVVDFYSRVIENRERDD